MKVKLNYVLIPAIVFGFVLARTILSLGSIEWYNSLVLPAGIPPREVFPVVWNIIGLFTSISLLLFYNKGERDLLFWLVLSLFTTNGLLNLVWTQIFFSWHTIGWSFILAIVLTLNVLALVPLVSKRSRLSALFLLPYLLWMVYSLYLNWQVWSLN